MITTARMTATTTDPAERVLRRARRHERRSQRTRDYGAGSRAPRLFA